MCNNVNYGCKITCMQVFKLFKSPQLIIIVSWSNDLSKKKKTIAIK